MERSSVDFNKLSPMMKEYIKTKSDYEDILLFYRLGDFYELFFEDAITASHALELTLTGKNAGLEERVPMCGVPHHAANIYIDKLIKLGYKVAICEQMEDAKNTKGIVKREVVQIVTAGSITNTDIISEKEYNFIGSVTDYNYIYALSYADLLSGKVFVCYIEHNTDKLISYLCNLNIKELIVSSSFDKTLIHALKTNYNIYVTIKDEEVNDKYKKLLSNVSDEKLRNNTYIVLSYLENTQKKDLSHFQNAIFVDNNDFLSLDKETVRNLELVETLRNKDRMNSLLWFLDKTKTAMGSRLLKSFIISPSIKKEEITKRHDLIELFNKEFLLSSELKEYLYEIYDLERLCGKVSISNINPKDLLQLKHSLKILPNINNVLEKLSLPLLKTYNEICDLLEKAIDEDAPITIKEGGIIKSGYNSELDELKSIRKNGKDFISKFESEERERTGIKTLKVGYNRVFGYYIEISKGASKDIKEEWMYERKQTISNSERFITPLLKEKENMILGAEEKINSLEYNLFLEIRETLKTIIKDVQSTSASIAFLDVMLSLSTVSEQNNFIRPNINNEGVLDIKEGWHPVVKSVIKDEYINNDIIMKNDENIMIITGPNMSGKSTYMRELAIIIILSQIGCFVPAKEANIPIFDKIFTRIGASDDVVGGESTFMVEMRESANALKNATKNSLILFDELGRGTSTYDGMSLAGSIIEYINKNIKCKTLFSTHYHELTKMEELNEGIKNVHVSIFEENGDVKFLHKVKEGPVDKSYGINVARLAGLPKEVLKKANELLKEYESEYVKTEIKQFSLDLEEKEEDELREFIKKINILEITPLEALNILNKIKEISEE